MSETISQIYLKQKLLQELKKAGLPASYPTIKRYEDQGIIPKPRIAKFRKRSWRVYTMEDIKEIIKAIRAYKTA